MQEDVKDGNTDVLITRKNTSEYKKLKYVCNLPHQQTVRNADSADFELEKTMSRVGLNAGHMNPTHSLEIRSNNDDTDKQVKENTEPDTVVEKYRKVPHNHELDDEIEMSDKMVGGMAKPYQLNDTEEAPPLLIRDDQNENNDSINRSIWYWSQLDTRKKTDRSEGLEAYYKVLDKRLLVIFGDESRYKSGSSHLCLVP